MRQLHTEEEKNNKDSNKGIKEMKRGREGEKVIKREIYEDSRQQQKSPTLDVLHPHSDEAP